MIPFKLTISGKEENIEFPSSYLELTLRQFIGLRKGFGGDVAKLLEILSVPSVPRSIWMNAPESIDTELEKYLNWIYSDIPKWEELKPLPEIEIAGKKVQIPKDLGYKSFGQKVLADMKAKELFAKIPSKDPKTSQISYVTKQVKDVSEVMPRILAIYLQPILHKKGLFDEEKIDEVEKMCYDLSVIEAYPIANFFLKRSVGSLNFGKTLSRTEKRKIERSRKGRVSKN